MRDLKEVTVDMKNCIESARDRILMRIFGPKEMRMGNGELLIYNRLYRSPNKVTGIRSRRSRCEVGTAYS
jgi:hypothetical protein